MDYYTGIKTGQDRLEKYELQKEKQSVVFELTQLNNYKSRNAGLKLAAILDERLKGKTIEYLEGYGELNNKLSSEEANYNKLCNSLSMLRGRQKILSQIIKNIKNQRPKIDQCPTCNQSLPGNLREFYLYSQDINDAIKEKERVSANIKKTTAKLNSAEKNVTSLRDEIKKEYDILNKFKTEGVDFNSWLDYQANLKMLENISFQTKKCEERISKIQGDIENLGNDSDIETLRSQKEKEFFRIFKEKTKSLKVKIPNNNKYRELYSMSSFPYQGVELHKIIMAYHFSFNEMLSKNSNVHKFPFMLDAIFKEDIDKKSREEIFKFVAEESKRDVQILFTVAEFRSGKNKSSDDYLFKISDVNDKYFSNKAKQICIGNAISERAFLSQSSLEDTDILHDAISLLETV